MGGLAYSEWGSGGGVHTERWRAWRLAVLSCFYTPAPGGGGGGGAAVAASSSSPPPTLQLPGSSLSRSRCCCVGACAAAAGCCCTAAAAPVLAAATPHPSSQPAITSAKLIAESDARSAVSTALVWRRLARRAPPPCSRAPPVQLPPPSSSPSSSPSSANATCKLASGWSTTMGMITSRGAHTSSTASEGVLRGSGGVTLARDTRRLGVSAP